MPRHSSPWRRLMLVIRDDTGVETVEYALVVCAVVLMALAGYIVLGAAIDSHETEVGQELGAATVTEIP